MAQKADASVAADTVLVDLREAGQAERTAGYLIRAPHPAVIETGGKAGVEAWLEALEQQWDAEFATPADRRPDAGPMPENLPSADELAAELERFLRGER